MSVRPGAGAAAPGGHLPARRVLAVSPGPAAITDTGLDLPLQPGRPGGVPAHNRDLCPGRHLHRRLSDGPRMHNLGAGEAANPSGSPPPPPGLWLLHWNGSAWTKVLHDGTHNYSPDLASDGTGGLWLTGFNSTTLAYSFVHFAGGLLTRGAEPGRVRRVGRGSDPDPRHYLAVGLWVFDTRWTWQHRERHTQVRQLKAGPKVRGGSELAVASAALR